MSSQKVKNEPPNHVFIQQQHLNHLQLSCQKKGDTLISSLNFKLILDMKKCNTSLNNKWSWGKFKT
jgi:hypothetical protein